MFLQGVSWCAYQEAIVSPRKPCNASALYLSAEPWQQLLKETKKSLGNEAYRSRKRVRESLGGSWTMAMAPDCLTALVSLGI